MTPFHNLVAVVATLGLIGAPLVVRADGAEADVVAAVPDAGSGSVLTGSASSSGPLFSRRIDSNRLGALRGGLDTSNKNNLNGAVRDNYASHVVTGANTIADGSFSNSIGLPTVIQNSGANVLIQNSTIVNVQLR